MIPMIVFVALLLTTLVAALCALTLGIRCALAHGTQAADNRLAARLKTSAVVCGAALAAGAGLVLFTQLTASTPPILDERGNPVQGSIAELRQVELNGRKEWISIRGHSQDNPVLLFLAGGPGGTQMAAVRHDLAKLERHFVVVNWDQPGSGKSYYADAIANITTETYVQDGYALTNYLRERFGEDKIVLVGESWGSALGVFLVDRHPELYHALVSAAQMVNFAETERLDYRLAMDLAEAAGDTGTLKNLQANGMPPYYGKGVTWKSAVYLNYLTAKMSANPEIHNAGYNTPRDIFSSEYGILDKINYARGVIDTFNHVYQQLYDIDMRTDYAKLETPVYFFLGRHDLNAPAALAQEYADVLEAPAKEIVWFEHSGHSPWINESDKFVDELLRVTAR